MSNTSNSHSFVRAGFMTQLQGLMGFFYNFVGVEGWILRFLFSFIKQNKQTTKRFYIPGWMECLYTDFWGPCTVPRWVPCLDVVKKDWWS